MQALPRDYCTTELQDTHQNAFERDISWMFHKWKMAIDPPRSCHAQQRDTATSNVQMDLGKNEDIGSRGLWCCSSHGKGCGLSSRPCWSQDSLPARYVMRDIMFCLGSGCGHPTCVAELERRPPTEQDKSWW